MRAVLLLLPLCGCGQLVHNVCPQIRPYSNAEQAELLTALQQHPNDVIGTVIVDDYGLRQQARACQKGF